MHLRRNLRLLFGLALVGALSLWLARPDRLGRTYPSLDELQSVQKEAGYLPIGYFGDGWPATLVEVLIHKDALTFARRDGGRHSYEGFEGYRLKMLRLLDASGKEVILILRSESLSPTADTDAGDNGTVRQL